MVTGYDQNRAAPRRPAKAATLKAPLVTAEAALAAALAEAEAEVRDALAAEVAEREAEDTALVAAEAALVAAALDPAAVEAPAEVAGAPVAPEALAETLAFTQDASDEDWMEMADEYCNAPVLSRTWIVIEVPAARSTVQTTEVPVVEGNSLRAAAPGCDPGMIEGKYGPVPPDQESAAGWH